MSTLVGYPQLQARLHAVGSAQTGTAIMKLAANLTRGQMVLGMQAVGARKTGMTGRSVHVEGVTATSAGVYSSQVALWIDQGTGLYGPKHQRIVPLTKKALSWMGGPASAFRLTGAVRKGKAGLGAVRITVRSTKGMKARPYLRKAVMLAAQQVGRELGAEVIASWNKAG